MNAPLDVTSIDRSPRRTRRLRPILTSRQRDCLILIARGKNDRQIAEVLGISDQTVHKHIEAAKKRYGVSTRIQLVMHALYIRYVDLAEIMERA